MKRHTNAFCARWKRISANPTDSFHNAGTGCVVCNSGLCIPEFVPSKVFVNTRVELLVIWREELNWNEGLTVCLCLT